MDPESVMAKLDVKLRTPTPPESIPELPLPWMSKTLDNPVETVSQTQYIKKRISSHQNSSPTSIYRSIDQLAKGTQGIMHQVALLRSEVQDLRQANEMLSKRRRAKKTRLRQEGSLTLQEGQDLIAPDRSREQQEEEEDGSCIVVGGVQPRKQQCRRCGNKGHNARTCLIEEGSF